MNHAQAIYQAIPSEVKEQFKFSAMAIVKRLLDDIESRLPFDLSNQEADFFLAIGHAIKDEKDKALFEAFGRVLTDE